jgi:hypothetical protein
MEQYNFKINYELNGLKQYLPCAISSNKIVFDW